MSRVAFWNLAPLALVLVVSSAVVWIPLLRRTTAPASGAVAIAPDPASLVDHSGNAFARVDYVRIASLSTVADELLLALCEPERIVAFTAYSARKADRSYRFSGKPTVEGEKDLERVLALHPDLVLVNHIADARPIARMREAGLAVYDLGEMRGMSTLLPDILEVAALVGHPERGYAVASTLVAKMATVAADVPIASRRRGIYLSVFGGRLYGGAAGTSYEDVLRAAGLVDAAAAYHDWPEYSVEQILAIDPDVIVTNDGMRAQICAHAGLTSLRACGDRSAIVELDWTMVGDPGPDMLEAAEAVSAAVYGGPGARHGVQPGTR